MDTYRPSYHVPPPYSYIICVPVPGCYIQMVLGYRSKGYRSFDRWTLRLLHWLFAARRKMKKKKENKISMYQVMSLARAPRLQCPPETVGRSVLCCDPSWSFRVIDSATAVRNAPPESSRLSRRRFNASERVKCIAQQRRVYACGDTGPLEAACRRLGRDSMAAVRCLVVSGVCM